MAVYQMVQWAGYKPVFDPAQPDAPVLPDVENDSIFVDCNLTQFTEQTEIFTGKTGLIFKGCNLVGCKLPADAITDDCNTHQNEYEFIATPERPDEFIIPQVKTNKGKNAYTPARAQDKAKIFRELKSLKRQGKINKFVYKHYRNDVDNAEDEEQSFTATLVSKMKKVN